ncbi:MAG TPA: hydrogen gas-evolving membrane-bound hydrogenase subunit E [Vitreimonas sp.]|nr:hydrogen gas-evolving membrane-bound hydrogenase subunit E [Vitreimonas sp.]
MTLLLTILAGFAAAPFGVLAGRRPVAVGLLLALVPAVLTGWFLLQVGTVSGGGVVVESIPWVPSLGVDLMFMLDGLSLLFALLVTGIGALVLMYSAGYVAGGKGAQLFPFLLAFMASMLGLVLSGNLLILYVFWAGTSLTSFLLIGFDFRDGASRSAAQQALLVTVAGELAMLGGFVLLGDAAGTYAIPEILVAGEAIRADPRFPAILVLILLGALTKSAQAPFHFWLPNAMAAPTPVSAYLHSATMVQAGVFLLARLHPVLAPAAAWGPIVITAGLVTMIVGAVLSLGATDLKRVLAYSTVSALGLLVLLLGLGSEPALVAAMVFLVAHAFYKAALFLVVGIVDHETGERSTDALGGLRRSMPFTTIAAVLAALSMAGLPPFFGFIGKELIYEAALPHGELSQPVNALLSSVGTFAASVAFVAIAVVVGIRPFFGRATPAAERAHGEPALLWAAPLALAATGIAVGLLPALLAGPVIEPAVSAVSGRAVEVKLALWHGFTPMLALSAVTLVAGAALFAMRDRVRGFVRRRDPGGRFGPERGYAGALDGIGRVALRSSALVQNGNLRNYLLTTLGTAVVLVAVAQIRAGGIDILAVPLDVRLHELVAAGLILVAAGVAVVSDSRLAAIAALGVVGYGVALIYLLFGAPDLAMTQILIETLTLILFVLVFYHLPGFLSISRAAVRLRDATISIAAGTVMGLLVLAVLRDEAHDTISGYFVEAAYTEAHARNVVNAILVDFRALDTLGEITVLALAGLGVVALLRLAPGVRQ